MQHDDISERVFQVWNLNDLKHISKHKIINIANKIVPEIFYY